MAEKLTTDEFIEIVKKHPLPWTKHTFYGGYAYDAKGKTITMETAWKMLDFFMIESGIMKDKNL